MGGFGDLDDFDEFMTFLEGDTKTFKMFFRDLGRGYSMGGHYAEILEYERQNKAKKEVNKMKK